MSSLRMLLSAVHGHGPGNSTWTQLTLIGFHGKCGSSAEVLNDWQSSCF